MRIGKAAEEAFLAFGQEADTYDQNYSPDAQRYPDHVYRLRIFEDLLRQIQPHTVLDAGCGSGTPLSTFLKIGYDAYGFDRSTDMVRVSQQRLINYGYDPKRVFEGDLDNFSSPTGQLFDAVVALGSVYYTPDTKVTIGKLTEQVKPGGALLFSLRNQLFSLCTLNHYSAEYLMKTIFPITQLDTNLKDAVQKFFASRFPALDTRKLFENVDERNIRSQLHNPLTVGADLLTPNGLTLNGLYYYHFHALPPIFEHTHQRQFYELSAKCEDPTDWRGLVTASCFIVHATKVQ